MDRLIHMALQDKPVAWLSPSYQYVIEIWRELCSRLAILCDKSEQEKRLELIGGGVIELWSLDSTDAVLFLKKNACISQSCQNLCFLARLMARLRQRHLVV